MALKKYTKNPTRRTTYMIAVVQPDKSIRYLSKGIIVVEHGAGAFNSQTEAKRIEGILKKKLKIMGFVPEEFHHLLDRVDVRRIK